MIQALALMRKLLETSFLILAGCTSYQSNNLNSWKLCSPEFLQEVSSLGGERTIDCGFLMLGYARGGPSAIHCGRVAQDSGKSFKLGYGSFGDDSGSRRALVQTNDGRLFLVSAEYSLVTSNGPVQTLSVSKCNEVIWADGSSDARAAPFTAVGCEQVRREG